MRTFLIFSRERIKRRQRPPVPIQAMWMVSFAPS
jgi:hypothetical protein